MSPHDREAKAKAVEKMEASVAAAKSKLDEELEMIEMIEAGYRVQTKVHHPDTGGSAEAMELLRSCRDALLKLVETWR